MKSIRIIIFSIIALVLVVGIWFVRNFVEFNPPAAQIEISKPDKTTLKVIGEIDESSSKEFIAALEDEDITKLVVTSGGGLVSPAIDIATKIFERGLKLELEGYCLSSCLNYFVPAAAETTVNQGAILGFHGTATTSADNFGALDFLFAKDIEREAVFFQLVGKPAEMYQKLEDKFYAYAEDSAIEDIDFWMVGADFFEENDFPLSQQSYFPRSQTELDERVEDIKQATGFGLTIIGDFSD